MKDKGFSKINSHNEWDKLKEIIVGTSKGTMPTLIWRGREKLTDSLLEKAYDLAKKAAPKWFYEEVSEDLQKVDDKHLQKVTMGRVDQT